MSKSNRASVPYSPRFDSGYHSANDEEDPYRAAAKPPEPTSCPQCHATYASGRWSWDKAPEDSFSQLCPACQRIRDHFPAGYVTVKGEFFKEHRDEIVALIENHEKSEKSRRPLQRIMGMEDTREGFQVTTTDSHLARGIAEALQGAYKGDLKLRYSRDENLVRAVWKR
jgi:hypothetical protein